MAHVLPWLMEELTNDTLYPGCDQIDQLGV
jgi:hypothetical protein